MPPRTVLFFIVAVRWATDPHLGIRPNHGPAAVLWAERLQQAQAAVATVTAREAEASRSALLSSGEGSGEGAGASIAIARRRQCDVTMSDLMMCAAGDRPAGGGCGGLPFLRSRARPLDVWFGSKGIVCEYCARSTLFGELAS